MPKNELTEEQIKLAEAVTAALAEADSSIRGAFRAAAAGGVSANEIARRAADSPVRGYSRPVVLEILGAESIKDKAHAALGEQDISVGSRYDDEADVEMWEGAARSVWIKLGQEALKGNTVTRHQLGVGVVNALRAAGLDVSQGDNTLDMYQALARGEKTEVYKV